MRLAQTRFDRFSSASGFLLRRLARALKAGPLFSHRRRKMVGVTGVEPVTLRLSSACSNQLSYTPGLNAALIPHSKVGGAEETRTPDL